MFIRHAHDPLMRVRYCFAVIGYVAMPEHGGRRKFGRAVVEVREGVGERPHFSQRTREMGHPAGIHLRFLLTSLLFQLPNPLLQELPLRFLLGQGQRFLIRRPSLGCPAEPAIHICTGGMRQVIIGQVALFS
jgi:hypothetical protein